MTWHPAGLDVFLGSVPRFAASDVEEGQFPQCPDRVGISARFGKSDTAPETEPFGQGMIARLRDIVEALARGRDSDADGGLKRAAETYRDQHAGVRAFLDMAALNYLEFLEAREVEVGRLTYVGHSCWRPVESGVVELKLWAPVYRSASGSREVHRLRYGSAKSEVTNWALVAAWIVSEGRFDVSVVEVGLLDGTESVLLSDASPTEIEEAHQEVTLPRLRRMYGETGRVPSANNCARCLAVTQCGDVIPLDLFAGQKDATPWLRVASQSVLDRHARCPAHGYLRSRYLPREAQWFGAADRGIRIHEWIAQAHDSDESCRERLESQVPPGDDLPYLRAHVEQCDRSGRATLAVERAIVGWDAGTGNVIDMRPDEVCRLDDGTLVLRELKTTENAALLDRDAAFDHYASFAQWWLAVLSGGLVGHFGATGGVLELEVLTPDGGAVHRFNLADSTTQFWMEGWAVDTPALWLGDRAFEPLPGPQCEFCDMGRWCPEGPRQP